MSAVPNVPEPVIEIVPDTDPPAAAPAVPTVTFYGRQFRIREQGVSLLALMKLATIAKTGLNTESMEGLAALYQLLRQCIHGDDWQAFEDRANEVGAKGEPLMMVVRDAVQASGRPTQQPSDSPGGQSTTAPSSAAASSDPGSPIRIGDPRVQHTLEERGRPDLALVVQRAREASTTP